MSPSAGIRQVAGDSKLLVWLETIATLKYLKKIFTVGPGAWHTWEKQALKGSRHPQVKRKLYGAQEVFTELYAFSGM